MELEFKWKMPSEKSKDEIINSDILKYFIIDSKIYNMDSHYYDTEDEYMKKIHGGLRLRVENNKNVVCIKSGDFSKNNLKYHEEFETEADNIFDGLKKLSENSKAKDICNNLLNSNISETCRTKFTRFAYTVKYSKNNKSFVGELAFDSGTFFHFDKSQNFSEIEFELKSGDKNLFIEFSKNLERAFLFEPLTLSKLARAISL